MIPDQITDIQSDSMSATLEGRVISTENEELLRALRVVIDEINHTSIAARKSLVETVLAVEHWQKAQDRRGKSFYVSLCHQSDGSVTLFSFPDETGDSANGDPSKTTAEVLEGVDAVKVAHFSSGAIAAMKIDAVAYDADVHGRLMAAQNPKYEKDMPHYSKEHDDDDEYADRLLDLWREHVAVFSISMTREPEPIIDFQHVVEQIEKSGATDYADAEFPLIEANDLRNRILYDTSLSDTDRGAMKARLDFLLRDFDGNMKVAFNHWSSVVDWHKGPPEAYELKEDVIRKVGRDILLTTGLDVAHTLQIATSARVAIIGDISRSAIIR